MVGAPRLRSLVKTSDSFVAESRTDHRHVLRRQIQPQRDLAARHSSGAQQDHPRPSNEPRSLGRSRHDRLQLLTLFLGERDLDDLCHAAVDAEDSQDKRINEDGLPSPRP
jgi:hypothetical protein